MIEDPLILSIETATLSGAVALVRGEQLLSSLVGDTKTSHSNTLLMEIGTLLKNSGHKLADIDVFAVATGPGSFTGLRIGIATVKGLSFTLKRPCVGIPTLEAIANTAGNCDRVVAVLPAGRGEVFVQMFAVSDKHVTPLDIAKHISPDLLLERYTQFDEICWCGIGAHLHRQLLKEAAEHAGRAFVEETDSDTAARVWRLLPERGNLAESVAILALQKIRTNDVVGAEDLTAIYVRPSDAELNKQPTG